MADLSNVLGGPWSPPPEKLLAPPEAQLIDAIKAAGLEPPDHIEMDGKIHRFKSGTKGTPGIDKPGWYLVFGDGIPAGRFGCWRAGIEVTWRADVGRKLTEFEEMAHARRINESKVLREAAQERQHQVASETVEKIWLSGGAAHPDHPYLKRKGIQTHGVRITGDGRLMAPLYDQDGTLSTLQYIDEDGGKLYHPGGKSGGKFWMVGSLDEPGTLYVAEGFATAATIHETTNRPCIVAYSASSLVPVIASLRDMYGATQDIVIVADHDKHGVGQRYADQASAKYGAKVIMPPIEGMDANDYAQAGHDLMALLVQQTGSAVIDKLKVIFGDQLGSEYEAPDELVEGLMTIGSSVVVYGDSNSGKTFWALSVATAIATGSDCYGLKTDPGLVIYLASEAPGSIRSRMQAIKKYHGCDLANLAMVPVPMNFYNGDQDAHDVIELVRAIEKIKGQRVRLIIGDTLARMSAGANENSGEDMGPVMARFDQVATATGAALMIIHHNGKDAAKGARGWSGIRAHIDTEIEVVEKEGIRSVTVTKQRELPSKGNTIYFKLEVIEMGTTKFGSAATTCVAVPDDQAASQPTPKTDSPATVSRKRFERAWCKAHCETYGGQPYLSRSALLDFLISNDGFKPSKAESMCKPDGQMIGPLLNADMIQAAQHGWVVVDNLWTTSMSILSNRA
jgi:putative DNA primase/helicase